MKYFRSLVILELFFALVTSSCGKSPPTMTPVVFNPTDGNIAKLLSRILEQTQYSHHPFDNEQAGKLLDRYLDALDGQRLTFLQSDLEEFSPYRNTLDELTKAGNVEPAQAIFTRFMHRLEQRASYVQDLLASEKFEFKDNDSYVFNRHESPWPKDLNDARQLWRQRLRYEYLQEKLNNHKPDEIVSSLTKRYTGLLRAARDLGRESVLELYLNSLANAYDPHSDYMGRSQFENFGISMKLSLVGIGAELTSEDGYPKITRVLPGPAARSKQLKAGDRLVVVMQDRQDPVDVVDMPLTKVVELIRGSAGTKVSLTVIPVDAADPSVRRTIVLTREQIKLEDQEAKARLMEFSSGPGKALRLGVIDLPSFYEDMESRRGANHKSTTEDVAKLLRKLKQEKVEGIILDLRQNGGGSLEEAISLTGLFIKRGPVVQVKDSRGKVEVYSDKDNSVLYDGPLIVLTSRLSASASEILAGALQDYGRALIVGDASTYGKGTVQSVIELAPLMKQFKLSYAYDPGALVITIQQFYRPSGASTQLRGVIPDVVLPSLSNFAEIGEGSMPNPLPWDMIRPAKYENLDRVQPFTTELQQRSAQRVKTDKDFAYLREDIEQFRKVLDQKTVSLNEEKRRQEKKELAARLEARRQERLARKTPEPQFFEITVENATKTGLAPATTRTSQLAAAHINPPAEELEGDLPDGFPSEKHMTADVTLEETKRILADLISLSSTKALGAR